MGFLSPHGGAASELFETWIPIYAAKVLQLLLGLPLERLRSGKIFLLSFLPGRALHPHGATTSSINLRSVS